MLGIDYLSGIHGNTGLNIPYNKALQMGSVIYKDLKNLLLDEDFETGVGDEGGF